MDESQYTLPASKDEVQRCLAARGFGTLHRWRSENRKWAKTFRKRRPDLAKILDQEYARYLTQQ